LPAQRGGGAVGHEDQVKCGGRNEQEGGKRKGPEKKPEQVPGALSARGTQRKC